ncbi:hypothetical protein GCM10020218_043730 [Dactylosporangium vinaceum]
MADEVIGALPVADRERVSVIVVDSAVGMGDAPLRNVRRSSSVRAAAEAVYTGRADAMVSAGSSGAAVAASAHVLGRLRGVRRPGLAAQLPTERGPVLLIDVGVTLDATMLELVQHAVLGAAYAAVALDIPRPRVGLLSIGSEPGKGDRLRRAVSIALSDVPLPAGARYVGLVEGFDVPRGGPADVIVTDGFTGNVLLKGIEAAMATARRLIRGHQAAAGGHDAGDGREAGDRHGAGDRLRVVDSPSAVDAHPAGSDHVAGGDHVASGDHVAGGGHVAGGAHRDGDQAVSGGGDELNDGFGVADGLEAVAPSQRTTSERSLAASERSLAASERSLAASERSGPASERSVSSAEPPVAVSGSVAAPARDLAAHLRDGEIQPHDGPAYRSEVPAHPGDGAGSLPGGADDQHDAAAPPRGGAVSEGDGAAPGREEMASGDSESRADDAAVPASARDGAALGGAGGNGAAVGGSPALYEAAAVLLGVAGDVVVCHGSAGGAEIADGIALAARLHRDRITPAVAGLADDLLAELSSAGGLTIRDALGERS